MFTAATGSVPSALHKIMMNGPRIGVKAVATDTGFAIIGTSPATYDGFIEAIGLEAYGGGIAPPVRCEIGDNGYGYPALTSQPPDEGFTSRCLVRDGCGHEPEEVAEAASQATGQVFARRTVRAYDLAAENYRIMVLIQGHPIHYPCDQQHRLRANTGLCRGSPDRRHPVHLRRHRDRTHTGRQWGGHERTRGRCRSPGGTKGALQHGGPNREGGTRRRGVRRPADACLSRGMRAITVGDTEVGQRGTDTPPLQPRCPRHPPARKKGLYQ